MRELLTALSSAGDSSPGEDMITYFMIKNAHPTLLNSLLGLYNMVFLEKTFPGVWLITIVIAILQPGKDNRASANYRPISLISALCKILEKMINNRLMWVLESQGLIAMPQSGFRPNRKTIDHLVQLQTDIRLALSHKLHTIALFFDLQKAYDTAWRYGVLRSLHDYGLRGPLPMFVANFLANRSIRVRIGGSLSRAVPLREGIPQGSVLSCTCFLIAINSVTTSIPRTVKTMLYVDDLTIYASGATTAGIERQLQLALNSLTSWCCRTGFQFSAAKTVSMHFCRKKGCPKLASNVTLGGVAVRCVTVTKFLGLTFDNSLTWKPHIVATKNKCNKTLNLFKKLSHTRWGSDGPTLVRLYIMLVKPLVEYGLEAFASAADTYLKSLHTIQNCALRIATGAFRTTPIDSLHAATSVLPPKYATHYKQLNFYLRLVVNVTHPLHGSIIDQEDLDERAILDRTPVKSFLARAHALHLLYRLDTSLVLAEGFAVHPPWRMDRMHTCDELLAVNKRELPASVLRGLFFDHQQNHTQTFHVYTDGSKTAEGVGYGYFCAERSFHCRISSLSSVYTAELLAIRDAITYLLDSCPAIGAVTIFSDSRSALQAVSSRSFHPIVLHIQDLIVSSDKSFTLCWVPSHVGIDGNSRADDLARRSISTLPVTPVSLPRSDFKLYLKQSVRSAWRSMWAQQTNNKLWESLPVIPKKYADQHSRSWSVRLFRLRTGHTRLTHEYLMSASPPPYCDDCIVPLTVKHILVECPSHSAHRGLFGCPGPPSLEYIFRPENCVVDGPLHRYLMALGIHCDL